MTNILSYDRGDSENRNKNLATIQWAIQAAYNMLIIT